jgi:SAM-dependent methyltransferase
VLSLERQETYRLRYAAENPGWRPATHHYRDLVATYATASARVLDLGCGRGGVLEELHPQAARALGLDPDLASLREHRIPGFARACGEADRLPLPDGALDLVCCSWVLEHLADPAGAFAEAARVLVPGGHFVFVTPNRRHPLLGIGRLLSRTRGRLVDRVYGRAAADTFPAFYRANTPADVDRLAEEAGLARARLVFVGDPTYLAFRPALYRLACLLERWTPASLRVHLVGDYVLSPSPSSSRPGTVPTPRR